MKVTTTTGFACEANDKIKNDFRFIEALADIESEDAGAMLKGQVAMLRLLLTKDGIRELYAHVQEPDGTVPADRVSAEVLDIIQHLGKENEIKN